MTKDSPLRIERPQVEDFANERSNPQQALVYPIDDCIELSFHSLHGGRLARLQMSPQVARLIAYLLVQGADTIDGRAEQVTDDGYVRLPALELASK
jgi:hypothetical protein